MELTKNIYVCKMKTLYHSCNQGSAISVTVSVATTISLHICEGGCWFLASKRNLQVAKYNRNQTFYLFVVKKLKKSRPADGPMGPLG